MPQKEIEEIFEKYADTEIELEKKLKQRQQEQIKIKENTFTTHDQKRLTLEEVKERNKNIFKELENVKGRLRSQVVFCPIEIEWEKICNTYQECPSLPVTKWRCHLPIFV